MKRETLCLRAGYRARNGEPNALPIYQSTAFRYDTAEQLAQLFDLKEAGFFYSRLGNPTVDAVEKKIAELEGGIGAMCTSSGQSANMLAVLNVASAGDHIVASSRIYGGTLNLFAVTLRKLGIETTFIDADASEEDIHAAFRPNTKALFGETIANPGVEVLDLEKFARIAHTEGVPFIIDNTFATPILCRPFEFGADIITHATTKYMDGHALQVGGVIVDSGRFDWTSGDRFPGLTQPDESYHGIVYTDTFGPAAYLVKARAQLMRDMGVCQSAHGAFFINQGLETLAVRMERHCRNAEKVAAWLEDNPAVEFVHYPRLESSPYRALSDKYLPDGCSGVISLSLKGGREAGAKFINSLRMISLLIHVADIRTCILHPASTTHRQLSDAQLAACGITPGMMRLSVGLEHVDDIIADLQQAMDNL